MKLEIKGRRGKRASIPCKAQIECQLALSRQTDAAKVIINLPVDTIHDGGYPLVKLILSYAEAEYLAAHIENAMHHAIDSSERAAISSEQTIGEFLDNGGR